MKKSIKSLMPSMLAQIEALDSLDVSVDISPECEEGWTNDHAICLFSFSPMGDYFDCDRFLDKVKAIGTNVFGRSAQWFSRYEPDAKRKAHRGIVMVFYSQEIEVYRNRTRAAAPKRRRSAAKARGGKP